MSLRLLLSSFLLILLNMQGVSQRSGAELNDFQNNFEPFEIQINTQTLIKTLNVLNSEIGNTVNANIYTDIDRQETFKIKRTFVMHPDLEAKFPFIQTFIGQSMETPGKVIRFSTNKDQFYGSIYESGNQTIFIDPKPNGKYSYITKSTSSFRHPNETFSCGVETSSEPIVNTKDKASLSRSQAGDCMLRTYRLALACTGEYAQFHGGTVADALNAMVVSMVRINGVYEKDFGITMQLIADNDELIYLTANSDPYTNNDGGAMLSQNQATVDNVIGSNNYDIGHVYSTGGGGIAGLGVPCGNRKAYGVTGLGSPINDPFYIDYVCHEMGHQFGGNHTQNNSCNRNGSTAMEPGSASTIMGYAGICSPNVQSNSDDHFHAISIQEVANYITQGQGNSCAVREDIGNNPPTVSVEKTMYTVPVNTAFRLEASASDDDSEDVLTYCWEQMDPQVATMPPTPTNTQGPAFRSNSPVLSPIRYFPNIEAIIAKETPIWEVLPFFNRDMNFRVTVRDNHMISGCTAEENVLIRFNEDFGPFTVQYPNGGEQFGINESMTVTWEVGNTTESPVSCANVDILMSIDGGRTYPEIVATDVPNSGEAIVNAPSVNSEECRMMVVCSDNVFLDISDQDFTISSPFSLLAAQEDQFSCEGEDVVYELNFEAFGNFTDQVDLMVEGLPAGANGSFNPTSISETGTIILTISNLGGLAVGNYPFTVFAESGTTLYQLDLAFDISASNLDLPNLQLPANQSVGLSLFPSFEWTNVTSANSYIFQLSENPSFSTTIVNNIVQTNSITLTNKLTNGTVYYWRVKALNACAEGANTNLFSFQTSVESCDLLSNDTDVFISEDVASTIESTITQDEMFGVASIKVSAEIDHSWVGDISLSLTNPNGDIVDLMSQVGVPASQYGCDGDNIKISFSDDALMTSEDLENMCLEGDYALEGTFQPLSPLADIAGLFSQGDWVLSVSDAFAEDGGELLYWDIDFCKNDGVDNNITLTKEVLNLPVNTKKNITPALLNANDPNTAETIYTLMSVPQFGNLEMGVNVLSIGDQFTQENINSNGIGYSSLDPTATADQFMFDVVTSTGAWASNQIFFIEIEVEQLTVTGSVTQELDCFGDSNGIIEAVGSGSTNFTYSINGSDFQNDPIFEGLSAGEYIVTVMDGDGQTSMSPSIFIFNPAMLTLSLSLDNYDIIADASGGTGDLEYSLDGNVYQSSNTFLGQESGDYTVFVRDANGCITSEMTSIQIELLSGDVEITNVLCVGDLNGVIELSGQGGIPPYSYSLDGTTYQSSSLFNNIGSGIYIGYIKDDNDDVYLVDDIIVQNPVALNISAIQDQYTIVATGMGGTGSLTYSIDGTNFQSNNTFENITNGNYTVSVMDENGCKTTFSLNVEISDLFLAADIGDITCNGDNDGILIFSGSGGFGPYEYSIDGFNFQSSPSFDGLGPGNYTGYIRDNGGVIHSIEGLPIMNPPILTISTMVEEYTITVSASGGTGNLTYSIDGVNFQSSPVFSVIDQSSYTITVMDQNGCQISEEVNVSISITAEYTTVDILCFDDETGNISILDPIGGVGPYMFSLNGGDFGTTSTFENLATGIYEVVIQDAFSGILTLSNIEIVGPINPVGIVVEVTDDVIEITASGGTGPYQYSVDNGMTFQEENIFAELLPGDYSILVVDANGCEVTAQASVEPSSTIEAFSLDILISPNPTDKEINIDIANMLGTNAKIAIVNMAGQKIFENTYSLNQGSMNTQIDFRNYSAGIYHVVLINDKNKLNQYTIIKQ